MTRPPRALAVWLLAGLFLVTAGWLASPHPVPLYDGIGLPDEPYRYVDPPPGARKTTPPSSVKAEVRATEGASIAGQAASDEYGPQVSLYLVDGALSVPSTATRIDLAAVPRAPSHEPRDAAIEGNIYVITATSDSGAVSFKGKDTADITLRAPVATKPLPVVYFRADAKDTWRALSTERIGQDNFRALLEHPGEYAVGKPGQATVVGPTATAVAARGAAGSSNGHPLRWLFGGGVLIMVLILVGLRIRTARQARRSAPPPKMTRTRG